MCRDTLLGSSLLYSEGVESVFISASEHLVTGSIWFLLHPCSTKEVLDEIGNSVTSWLMLSSTVLNMK